MNNIYKSYVLALSLFLFLFSCRGVEKTNKNNPNNLSSSFGTVVTELDNQIWEVFQDRLGNFWFGSKAKGVFYYDGKKLIQYTTKDGLIDDDIRSIQEDPLGNVFIGTPSGVNKFDGEKFTEVQILKSKESNWKLEPNDLWFNCNGNNLYRYNGQYLIELNLPEQNLEKAFGRKVYGVGFADMNNSPYAVYGINKDKKGNLWLGTVTVGAFRYDGTSFLWIAEPELSTLPDGRVPGVRSILEDKNGFFWLSNFRSKYRIYNEGKHPKYEKQNGTNISSGLFEDRIPYFLSGLSDSDENLWMITYAGGVWKYDGAELTNYPIPHESLDVLLISICMDKEGKIWLGSDNDGVYTFDGDRFEKFVPTFSQMSF